MELEDILRFVNLVCAGVVAGILVVVLVAVMPTMRELPDAIQVQFKQRFDRLVDRVNPPAVVISIITGVLILAVADDLPSSAVIFGIVGLAGSVGVVATSLGVNMRINRRIEKWSSESPPPPEFLSLIARWMRFHAARTAFGVAAFAAFVIAALAAID